MAADPSSKALVISWAEPSEIGELHDFHHSRAVASEYLWPRDRDGFEDLIDERALFVLRDEKAIVGLAYTSDAEEDLHYEFGGVFLDETVRGLGAAAALGKVAISTLYTFLEPIDLIAHVHEFNQAPRGLLRDQLGFVDLEKQIVPPVEPPENMKRNKDGDVVGDLFRFRTTCLADYADWLTGFDGYIKGRRGRASLELDGYVGRNRQRVCQILRDKAG
jgi:hypothetical protein